MYAIIVGSVLSGLCAVTPIGSELSPGSRIIMLTVLISAIVAWLKPIKMEDDGNGER